MPMRVERRTLVLVGALVVALVGAWWFRSSGSPTVVASGTPRPGAAVGQAGANAGQAPIDVRIEALSAERQSPTDGGRNPFEFRARVAPAAPPPPPSSETPFGGSTPPVPTGPPPPPPITLKFIGLVEKADGMKVAVLSDGRTAPMYGTVGQTLDGRYRIVAIGVESIELEYVDGRGRQTIRLSGQ